MGGLVAELIGNYSAKKNSSVVYIPPGNTLHYCIEALIFFGFVRPYSSSWRWSSGWLKFRIVKGRFEELKKIAKNKGL